MSPKPSLAPIASLPKRLKPPATLSALACKEFTRIVVAEPAAHFKESDLSLLVQYCEAVAMAERAVQELQRDDAPVRSLMLWEKATRVMTALSMRLRISPQSRAPNAPKREKLSVYEKMALEQNEATRLPPRPRLAMDARDRVTTMADNIPNGGSDSDAMDPLRVAIENHQKATNGKQPRHAR